MNWIKTSEGLPESGKRVSIVVTAYDEGRYFIPAEPHVCVGHCGDKGAFGIFFEDDGQRVKASHWAPLRELPEDKAEAMSWIKVEDELPKDSRWILTVRICRESLGHYIDLGHYRGGAFYSGCDGGQTHIDLPIRPTHWMELPELPSQE